ncbi:MAG: hypothetical protein MJ252_30555, partial [archaeon]|nr:hypothetical protein [archaeon]
IDDHTPVSITDLRLIRRIVRDFVDRGCSPEKTIEMWPSVREGEFKWIYPNISLANFIFNTELDYETNVYSEVVVPILRNVLDTSKAYSHAQRLAEYLELYEAISPKFVPTNTLIMEFVGKFVLDNKGFSMDNSGIPEEIIKNTPPQEKREDKLLIYQASLRFLIAMICKRLFPKYKIKIKVSVCMSYFIKFQHGEPDMTEEDFNMISSTMEKIVKDNLPINKKNVTVQEAIKIFKEQGMMDKVNILQYRKENNIDIYECDGYYDYLYSSIVPSTGYLYNYELRMYPPGLLLRYPRVDKDGQIPKFLDDPAFRQFLSEATEWSRDSITEYISDTNDKIKNNKIEDFINKAEGKFASQMEDLIDKITSDIKNIKLICVAGPSSSGKTTFTGKVKQELMKKGYEPLMISMDDFYMHQDKVPKIEGTNKPDFEHIEALDLPYFDEVILKLTKGEEVKLPIWDFAKQERQFKDPIKLKENQPILIEGIHGLNDRVASSIPKRNKFKIYISPLKQINIDDHTPVSITDLRLIRR